MLTGASGGGELRTEACAACGLRRVEVLVVVAASEFPPVVALVLAFAERFGEIAEVVCDRWVRVGKPVPHFAFGVVAGVTFGLRHLLTAHPAGITIRWRPSSSTR
jgi:hypothetical protein